MKQDELKLVLEALKWCHGGEPCGTAEAIVAIKEALAQPQEALKALIEDLRLNHEFCPKEVILQAADELERLARHDSVQAKPEQEQEPDYKLLFDELAEKFALLRDEAEMWKKQALFRFDATATPPQRTWVGLTAGEIFDVLISVDEKTVRLPFMLGQFACAIEAKLKELNT